MLQKLRRTRPLRRISLETLLQEVLAALAQLVFSGLLWRIALGNVVHDGPLIVQRRPRTTTSAHLEDHAT